MKSQILSRRAKESSEVKDTDCSSGRCEQRRFNSLSKNVKRNELLIFGPVILRLMFTNVRYEA